MQLVWMCYWIETAVISNDYIFQILVNKTCVFLICDFVNSVYL